MTPWERQLRLLTTIPGINRSAASTILIEIGPDIEAFASKQHFAAWVGLCPGNNESGGKRRNARTRRGARTLRASLVEYAHGIARTKGCQFEAHHSTLAAPRGYKRAIVWGAHKMLRIIYVVMWCVRVHSAHRALGERTGRYSDWSSGPSHGGHHV